MTPRFLDRFVYAFTALFALAISVAMLLPLSGLPQAWPGADKVQHFVAFLVLTVPICARHPRAALWLVPAAAVLGGAIEVIQPLTGRTRELADFVADVLGALAGAWLGRRWAFRRAV